MNFHDKKPKPQLTPDGFLSAFEERVEILGFRVGDRDYVVKAEYDECRP